MEDANYINRCTHRIVSDRLEITPVPGSSTLYCATLTYPALMDVNSTFIRSYNDEKTFLYSDATYEDVLTYPYKTITGDDSELPISKVKSAIGITNFRFVSPTEIIFGEDAHDESISRIKIGDGIIPKNIYLIDYYVQSATCPLCSGKDIVQDIAIDGTGSVFKAKGHQKLAQTVMKVLITSFGQSAEDVSYGSSLNSLIGSNIDITTTASIQKCIFESLDYIMTLQSNKELDAEETLTGVDGISIEQDKDNPAGLNLVVTVRDGNGDIVPCAVSLGVQ